MPGARPAKATKPLHWDTLKLPFSKLPATLWACPHTLAPEFKCRLEEDYARPKARARNASAAAQRVVSFVPAQKQPGLALFFRELKVVFETEDIGEAIQALLAAISAPDPARIGEEFLKGLWDTLRVLKPHIEEARGYDGDLQALNQFDKLCFLLSSVEDADKTVGDWYYRRVQVFEDYAECSRALTDLHDALVELLSREWKELLRVLLAVGNHLNPHPAEAFAVSQSLGYIASFPATRREGDTKYGANMLETVVQYVSQHHAKLLDIDRQIRAVRRAEALAPGAIQARIQGIKDQVDHYKDILGMPRGTMATVMLTMQNISPSDADVKLGKEYGIDTSEYVGFISSVRRRVAKMTELSDMLALFSLLNQIGDRRYVGDALPMLTERVLCKLFSLPLTTPADRGELREVITAIARAAHAEEARNFVRIAAAKLGLADVDRLFPKRSSATHDVPGPAKRKQSAEQDPAKKALHDFVENTTKLTDELDAGYARMRATLTLLAEKYGQDNLRTNEDALRDLIVSVNAFLARWQTARRLLEKAERETTRQSSWKGRALPPPARPASREQQLIALA